MKSTSEEKYAQSKDADASMAGDRVAIFHRGTQAAITLNPSGTVLWNSLSAPHSAMELVAILCKRYPGLTEDQAETDVSKFLQELLSHQMLSVAD